LNVNQDESVQSFLTRVTTIVNQIRSCGENLYEKIIVMKVLHSLTTKFDYVVTMIEESKHLSTYTFDELMGSLQVHEARLNRSEEKNDSILRRFSPKAIQVEEVVTSEEVLEEA
jgi:gag-polypeptide of LTR copia-type